MVGGGSSCTVPLANRGTLLSATSGPRGRHSRNLASGCTVGSGRGGGVARGCDTPRPTAGVAHAGVERAAPNYSLCIRWAQTASWAPCLFLAHGPWSSRPCTDSSRRRWNSTATMIRDEGNAGPARTRDWRPWPSRLNANRTSRRRATACHCTSHRLYRTPRRQRPKREEGEAQALRAPRQGRPRRRRRAARRSPPKCWRPRARRSRPKRKHLGARRRRLPARSFDSHPRRSQPRSITRTASPRVARPRLRRNRCMTGRSKPRRRMGSRRRCRPRLIRPVSA